MTRAIAEDSRRHISIADLNTEIDAEPRVQDIALGEGLGFSRPRAIRQIIDRNALELQAYGSLATRRGKSRGQEFVEYFLNEPQALLICMWSNTPKAAAVRKMLIDVFMEYRRGKLEKPIHVEAHTRRTSTKVDDALRLKKNIDRLESVVDAIQPQAQPNFCAMIVDGEPVFVDVNSYAQSGRAVVIGHNGQLRIEHVEPDTIGVRPFGPRTALGERRPGAHGTMVRNSLMVVGMVVDPLERRRQAVVDDVSSRLRGQITTLLESGPWNDRQIASQLCCNPKLVREVRREQSRKPTDQLPRVGLARRTIEHDPGAVRYGEWIVPLIEKGYSNKAISKMLGCHEETVRRHRVRLVS